MTISSGFMDYEGKKKRDNARIVQSDSGRYLDSILVKDDVITFVETENIYWITASGNYVKLHCEHEIHMIRGSLKKMEEKLHPAKFVRIHKSTMINVNKVRFIESSSTGDLRAAMECGKVLKISRNYKDNLEKFRI